MRDLILMLTNSVVRYKVWCIFGVLWCDALCIRVGKITLWIKWLRKYQMPKFNIKQLWPTMHVLLDESICKEINNNNFWIISLFLKQKCKSIAPWENDWIYSSNKSSTLNKQLSRVQLYTITTSFHFKNRYFLLSILILKSDTSYQ